MSLHGDRADGPAGGSTRPAAGPAAANCHATVVGLGRSSANGSNSRKDDTQKLLTTGSTIPPAASARDPAPQRNHSGRVEGPDHMSQLAIIKHTEIQYMLRGPVGLSVESYST